MAPRGGGLAGPRLLSILSCLASDGPLYITDRILSWKKTQRRPTAQAHHPSGFLWAPRGIRLLRKYSVVAAVQYPNMHRCVSIYDCENKGRITSSFLQD